MRIGIAFAAMALVFLHPPAALADPAAKDACEFQNDTCIVPPKDWPISRFRTGLAVMQEVNPGSIFGLYPHQRDSQGVSTDFDTDFGAEFSWGWKTFPRTRIAFLFAPLSVDYRTRWPTGKEETHLYFHGTAFLELQYRGVCLTAGTAGYKMRGSFRHGFGNWDNTSIGLGFILLRLPGWGGKYFFPEWRHW
jgi:hypothetical protein